MEGDTRGNRKKFGDSSKRFNAREQIERQYRKDARVLQSQGENNQAYEADDSEKFLKKQREKEEKARKNAEKAAVYQQEMNKCMPKNKGDVY